MIVNDVRYDSLPGFFNRKAAEQSAAEVALQELAKSSDLTQSVSLPVVSTSSFLSRDSNCLSLVKDYSL